MNGGLYEHMLRKVRKENPRAVPLSIKLQLPEWCSVCGTWNDIEYHHIVPYSWGGKTEVDNIAPLCHKCHVKIHSLLSKAVMANTEQEYKAAMEECAAFWERRNDLSQERSS
jgi:5-methylcytosine-specific restriction endonuclease McrA